MVAKVFGNMILAIEKVLENIRDWLERWKNDLSLIAAHAKLGIKIRGCCKLFRTPVKGMAKRAQNVHVSKAVDHPGGIEWLVCDWQCRLCWWLLSKVIHYCKRWRLKANNVIDQRRESRRMKRWWWWNNSIN